MFDRSILWLYDHDMTSQFTPLQYDQRALQQVDLNVQSPFAPPFKSFNSLSYQTAYFAEGKKKIINTEAFYWLHCFSCALKWNEAVLNVVND